MLVGTRDVATRTIRRTFAAAPLDDFLGSGRVDWRPSDSDALMIRYAGRAGDGHRRQHPRSRDRLGLAAAAQPQHLQLRRRHLDAHLRARRWSTPPRCRSAPSTTRSCRSRAGPQLTFPEHPGRIVLPRAAGHDPEALSVGRHASVSFAASHSLRAGGEWQRVDALFDLGVFRDGRIELVEDFATFDHNGDGRVDDGDLLFAVTLRSGKPDQSLVMPDADNNYVAMFVQDDWRLRSDLTLNLGLRYELDTDVKNISRVGRDQPDRAAVPAGHRGTPTSTTWDRGSASTGRPETAARACTAATASTTTASRSRSSRSSAASTGGRCRSRCAPATSSSSIRPPASSRRSRRRSANPFTGFILPGAGASGINIIDNGMQNPSVQQFNLGVRARAAARTSSLRVDGVHNLGTHFIIGRTDRHGLQPGRRRAGPRRQPRVERQHSLRRAAASAPSAAVPASGSAPPTRLPRRSTTPTTIRSRSPTGRSIRTTCGASTARRPTTSGIASRSPAWGHAPGGILVAPMLTLASGVPMDILMPDAQSRVPAFQRNAGGRPFKTARRPEPGAGRAERVGRGRTGSRFRSWASDAKFSDGFSSFDLRVSRPFDVRPASHRADGRGVQPVQRDQHPWRQREELLRLRQRARPRQPAIPPTRATCDRRASARR